MDNSRNFSENTVGNNAIVNQGNGNHITVNADTSNADTSFLQEISKTDPVYDKKRILMLKGPLLKESFSWILEHEGFNRWRNTKESGVLWIKGDPGKGKTMLLCGIIEDLEQNSQNEHLSYFFCQATDYRINTAAAVVGGLIRSLLNQHPALLSRIRERHGNGPKGQLDGPNALVILSDIFETITNDTGLTNVICVVDALDECITDCRRLLNLIIKTSGRVKWLLSSRNEKDMEKGLDHVPQKLVLELKQNAEQISISIDQYISHHIQEIDALKDDEQLQTKTFDMLKSKAQGTFLWVALVVDQLHNTDHWRVEDVLEEVPKDLEDLYSLILDRTEKLGRKGREACQVLLSIVTTAKRPLHLEELLVFVNSHWKESKHFKTTYNLRDIRDMAKDCGSILSIREDTIYFIHQSAKDYVVENAAQRIFPILHQHYKMFETSLDAMSNILDYDIYDLKDPGIHLDEIPQKDLNSDPLASIGYCCIFWIEHLVSGYQFTGFNYGKYLKDNGKVHSFLKKKFLCWIESLALMRSFYPHAQTALQKLMNLIASYCDSGSTESGTRQATQLQRESETQGIRQFTDDSYRFVENSKESVAYWPLQLYFSALSFGQDNCSIRKTFEQTVRAKFGSSPTLASVRHGRPLFWLQSTLYVPGEPSVYTPSDKPKPLIFSPDSSLIGQLNVNNSISTLGFWRADSKTLECTFPINLGSKVAFFPNSDDFISVSQDGIMKRWNMDKKSSIGDQSLGFAYVSYNPKLPSWANSMGIMESLEEMVIALSPKGDLVASWYPNPPDRLGLVRIWDTKTACCRSSFESDELRSLYAVFSPNSKLLAISFRDGFGVHNTETGAKVRYLVSPAMEIHRYWKSYKEKDRELETAWFTPNSKFLITRVSEWRLCLWDTHTWELLHDVTSLQRSQPLEYLAISPDSAILATKSTYETKFWSIKTGKCVAKVSACPASMSFAPNWTESSLIALQLRNIIQTWFINITQAVSEMQHTDYVFDNVIISPNSNFVATNHKNRDEVYVWSAHNGQLAHVLKGVPSENTSSSSRLIFSPDSQLLAWNFSGIQIWSVITGEFVCLFGCEYSSVLTSLAFSNDSKHLITGSWFNDICVWCIDSGQLIYRFELDKSWKQTETLMTAISPDSAYAAASWDAEGLQGRIWDLHTSKTVLIRPPQKARVNPARGIRLYHSEEANTSFSSDSAILALVTDRMAHIFDVPTGACLQSFALDCTEDLRLLSFDPTNGRIFTAKSVFYKTSSWSNWQMSPRLGYSYSHSQGNFPEQDIWILLDGKKNCYVPSNFRAGSLWSRGTTNVAMTDSLLALLNELAEVVIIKFPIRRELPQVAMETFDVDLTLQGTAGSSDNLFLVADTPSTSYSNPRTSKRRRSTSSESSSSKRREKVSD